MNLRKLPRTLVLTAGYAALLNAAVVLALLLRYDGAPSSATIAAASRLVPAWTVLSLLGYLVAGLYHGLWRYAGTETLFQMLRGITLSAVLCGRDAPGSARVRCRPR
jgi:UDP-GlcNAc:undecaprenyl-phosphate GlcNAc-1-phosphate transferase